MSNLHIETNTWKCSLIRFVSEHLGVSKIDSSSEEVVDVEMEDVAEVLEETDDNAEKHLSSSSFVVVMMRLVLFFMVIPL